MWENQEEQDQHRAFTDDELTVIVEALCDSKAREIRLLGYEQVTGKEVWDCINSRYTKTGTPALHKLVNDILSLKALDFMNWMTISAYKGVRL